MRRRRLLLATTALSTLASTGCTKTEPPKQKEPEVLPLPGNPKGSFYDAAEPVPTIPADAAVAPVDAEVIGPPANPKGSFYDAGIATAPVDAGPVKPPPPRDAGPIIRRMPANPKGSHYDKSKKPPGDP